MGTVRAHAHMADWHTRIIPLCLISVLGFPQWQTRYSLWSWESWIIWRAGDCQYHLFTAAKLVVKLRQGFECKCPAKYSYTDSFMKQILLYSAGILQITQGIKKMHIKLLFSQRLTFIENIHTRGFVSITCVHIYGSSSLPVIYLFIFAIAACRSRFCIN